jgi:hypothetical protein
MSAYDVLEVEVYRVKLSPGELAVPTEGFYDGYHLLVAKVRVHPCCPDVRVPEGL